MPYAGTRVSDTVIVRTVSMLLSEMSSDASRGGDSDHGACSRRDETRSSYRDEVSAFLLLGCGYTGERVARMLLERGHQVHAMARDARRLSRLAERHARVGSLDIHAADSIEQLKRFADTVGPVSHVLWSIPARRSPGCGVAALLGVLDPPPIRVVYLSTSAVYGEATRVDEQTPAIPSDAEGRLRLEVEREIAGGPWSTLVLRPAAIYGPHRGVHVFLRRGTLGRVVDLDRVVSRVHVDDLAALTRAGLSLGVTGTFPVADDEPATTREVAAFCARIGLPILADGAGSPSPGTSWRGRRVAGKAIRGLLGIQLRYPSYRDGIPSAIQEETLEDRHDS